VEAREVHQLLLNGPDGAQRAAAVEVLGTRAEAGLEPVLLQACADPLTDIAERARFFIGQLPDAADLAKDLLHSPAQADFQLGLRLVSEHRFPELVPDLLALLQTATRDDLVLQLVDALGAMGPLVASQGSGPLLLMLHSGQNLRLQTAVAQALGAMQSMDVARALCAKADEIKVATLHGIAVEALAAAVPALRGAGQPVPPDTGVLLLGQTRQAWNDRNPWTLRLRLVVALQALEMPAPQMWLELSTLVNEALGEKRSPNAWSPEDLRQVQTALKDFAKRGA